MKSPIWRRSRLPSPSNLHCVVHCTIPGTFLPAQYSEYFPRYSSLHRAIQSLDCDLWPPTHRQLHDSCLMFKQTWNNFKVFTQVSNDYQMWWLGLATPNRHRILAPNATLTICTVNSTAMKTVLISPNFVGSCDHAVQPPKTYWMEERLVSSIGLKVRATNDKNKRVKC